MTIQPSIEALQTVDEGRRAGSTLAWAFNDQNNWVGRALRDAAPPKPDEPLTPPSESALVSWRSHAVGGVLDLEVWATNPTGPVPEGIWNDAPDNTYGAVMIFSAPGKEMTGEPDERNPDSIEMAESSDPETGAAAEQFFGDLHKLEIKAWGPSAAKDIFYVDFLGTAPWAERKGLAASLLRKLFERGEREGVEVGLITQTESNMRYYTKIGFHVVAESDITIRSTTGHFYAMSNKKP